MSLPVIPVACLSRIQTTHIRRAIRAANERPKNNITMSVAALTARGRIALIADNIDYSDVTKS